MKIAMINCSPKLIMQKEEPCASHTILMDAKKYFRRFHVHDMEDIHIKTSSITNEEIELLFSCDTWIFSFPIYAGGIPAHLLRFMTTVEEKAASSKRTGYSICAIANGGLYEGNEALPALSMFRIWSEKCGFRWCGGIGIGGGWIYADTRRAYLNIAHKRTYARKLSSFCEAIAEGHASLSTFCSPDMPKKRFTLYMNRRLRGMARSNGISVMDLDKQT
jgi:hypothetical protein